MNLERYKVLFNRIDQKVRELESEGSCVRNIAHITLNALSEMGACMRRGLDSEDRRTSFRRRFLALKTYLKLLDTYPEFKSEEKGSYEGYFKDIGFGEEGDGDVEYVYESKRRLESKA